MHRCLQNHAPGLFAAACALSALVVHAAPPADDLILRVEMIEWRGPDESKPVDRPNASSCVLLRCIEVQVIEGRFAAKSLANDERIELSGELTQLPNDLYGVKLRFAVNGSTSGTAEQWNTPFKRGDACRLMCHSTRNDNADGSAKYIVEDTFMSLRRAGEAPPEAPNAGKRYLEQRAQERLTDLGADVDDPGEDYAQQVTFSPGWTGKQADLDQLKRFTALRVVYIQPNSLADEDQAHLKVRLPDVEIRSVDGFPSLGTTTFPMSLTTYNEPAPPAAPLAPGPQP